MYTDCVTSDPFFKCTQLSPAMNYAWSKCDNPISYDENSLIFYETIGQGTAWLASSCSYVFFKPSTPTVNQPLPIKVQVQQEWQILPSAPKRSKNERFLLYWDNDFKCFFLVFFRVRSIFPFALVSFYWCLFLFVTFSLHFKIKEINHLFLLFSNESLLMVPVICHPLPNSDPPVMIFHERSGF